MSEMIDDDQETRDFGSQGKPQGGKAGRAIVTILVIIIIIAAAWFLLGKYSGLKVPGMTSKADTAWEAVFLTNGQVYFGKVKNDTGSRMVLTDIYYLQVVEVPLQTTQTGSASDQKTQQELKLIKLGNELHGPVDEMVINRDQIILTERLKNDSRVVQAINNYLAEQKAAAQPKP